MKISSIFLIIIVFLGLCCCKKENQPGTLFHSTIGTKWIYLDYFQDTIVYELTDHREINGESVLELSVTQDVTNRYFYKQTGDKIYLYAQYVPKYSFIYSSDPPTDLDTLIIFSQPSLEFVLGEQIGYTWYKRALMASWSRYIEYEVPMEIIDQEQIETPAGVFQCSVIRDSENTQYYVADQGLIKIKRQIETADSTIEITQILIAKM
jgi:hypothetical protein